MTASKFNLGNTKNKGKQNELKICNTKISNHMADKVQVSKELKVQWGGDSMRMNYS